MSKGSIFKKEFQANAKGVKGEVALFRAFIKAFSVLGKESISKEFHGNKYQVIFNNGRGAGRLNPRCELCDVAIIQYQEGKASSARITFNQAKVTLRKFSCGVTSSSTPLYKFSANLEQWDLLSNRPYLSQAVSTFLPPKKLLSGAILPSVGSFGVFYPVGSSFEYAYFVADGLYPITNNPGKSGVLRLKTPLFELRTISGFDEISGTCCLETFSDALDAGFIGTPIIKLIGTSNDQNRELKSWFSNLIKGLQRDYPESELPNELLAGLELNQVSERDSDGYSGDYPQLKAVVVVRTNSNETNKVLKEV